MIRILGDLFLLWLAAMIVAALYAQVVWALEHRRGFLPWCRRWNPFYLKSELALLKQWLSEDRNSFDDDRANTSIEQAYRFACSILAGDAEPANDAQRYSVKGGTLSIKITAGDRDV